MVAYAFKARVMFICELSRKYHTNLNLDTSAALLHLAATTAKK
jgi:hypothetical protein